MDILKYKDYEGTAELDMARGICRGKILFIDDLVTYQAATPAELRAEFETAVDDYLATCAEVGKEPQRPFRGMFNVRVPPALHRTAALRAASDEVSLNDIVVRALDCFLSARTDINHNVVITLAGAPQVTKTVRATAAGDLQWMGTNVH